MAIDTRAKRSSVQAYATGFTLPPPDGTIAESDRAHVSWLYQGIDYDSPVVSTLTRTFWPIGLLDLPHN